MLLSGRLACAVPSTRVLNLKRSLREAGWMLLNPTKCIGYCHQEPSPVSGPCPAAPGMSRLTRKAGEKSHLWAGRPCWLPAPAQIFVALRPPPPHYHHHQQQQPFSVKGSNFPLPATFLQPNQESRNHHQSDASGLCHQRGKKVR